jgi:hypothetical protein
MYPAQTYNKVRKQPVTPGLQAPNTGFRNNTPTAQVATNKVDLGCGCCSTVLAKICNPHVCFPATIICCHCGYRYGFS